MIHPDAVCCFRNTFSGNPLLRRSIRGIGLGVGVGMALEQCSQSFKMETAARSAALKPSTSSEQDD